MKAWKLAALAALLMAPAAAYGAEGYIVVNNDTLQVGEANYSVPTAGTVNTLSTPKVFTITGKVVWVRVKCTLSVGTTYPWSVRFYGAKTGSSAFAPMMRSQNYWRAQVGTNVGTSDDTLKITRRGDTGTNGNWYPLLIEPGASGPQMISKMIAVCSNDSATATNGSRATFIVEVYQRP